MPPQADDFAVAANLQDKSFLDLYLHAVGTSEIPIQYHSWCSLLTIAACVNDNVWIEKFTGKKLCPNLYLILLGPSGIGKGGALGFAESLVKDIPNVNTYNGMITAPKLIDKLGKPYRDWRGRLVAANSKIFLLTPELALSVGDGLMASKFVKLMTQLFEGGEVFCEGNRTSGDVIIRNHCINWGAGSTPVWLVESLPRSAIESGFLARTVVVPADYNYIRRVPEPTVPSDYSRIHNHLKYRCMEYASLSGVFELTDGARSIHERWYLTRPPESESALEAAWHRDDDLVYKLSMLLSLAESLDLVIDTPHIVAAQKLVSGSHRVLPRLLSMAMQSPETESLELIREILRKNDRMTHRALLMRLSARGKKSRDVNEAMRTLRSIGEVEYETGVRGGLIYKWKG